MNEASKTRLHYESLLDNFLHEPIIDIGCGTDKIRENAVGFDLEDGDAERIDEILQQKFRTVFASHVLEHMSNPEDALKRWARLLEPGGHLIFLVPDEDLYEQGHFPSIFNPDHKATFTISKANSWSPRSFNVLDMVTNMRDFSLVYLKLQDNGYERALMSFGKRRLNSQIAVIVLGLIKIFSQRFAKKVESYFFAVDQTRAARTLAQIAVVLRKK